VAARNSLFSALARGLSSISKAVVPVTRPPASSVSQSPSWWGSIRESFAGAWQQNAIVADPHHTLLAFSAVYSCVTLIAADISKLRIKLVAFDKGVWTETQNGAFSPVLRKPNNYQTRIQFISQWVQSKLIYGNAYVLKERDARGIVVAMYCLDPRLVKALVTDNGEVFYDVGTDRLLGRITSFTVPASEIIHDRAVCFFHPLVGIGPLYACGISATQGNRIQQNSARFFENMSRPSGMLTAPETISDEVALRLKAEFEANFSGANIGRLLVAGDGLKYEAMTIPAEQAQLIEQLRWTVEDVARCFHVPLHKIASDTGVKFNNMAAMNQDYYSQTLQELIEGIELLLDEGLGLTGGPQVLGVELDLEGLLRMDPVQRAQRNESAMNAGYMAPDEARASENLPPVAGGAGKEPFMQQQKFPLSVLIQQAAPGSTPAPAPATDPVPDPNAAAAAAAAAQAAKSVDDLQQAVTATMDRVSASVAEIMTRAAETAAEQAARAAARVAELETAAERRHADQLAILARVEDEIESERKALIEERARVADEKRVAAASADLHEVDAEDLAQALIAKFTEAAREQ